jgi:hypothetical protein
MVATSKSCSQSCSKRRKYIAGGEAGSRIALTLAGNASQNPLSHADRQAGRPGALPVAGFKGAAMRSACLPSLGLALVAFLGGSTAVAGEEGTNAKRVCIDRREISAISSLDDRHGFVKISANRFYLLTLDKACRGFKLARQITISEAWRVCNDGLTLLSFQYPAEGTIRCRIEGLDSVLDKDMAWELIKSRAEPQ